MLHYNVKPIRLMLRPSSLLAALLATVILGACLIVLCMPAHLMLRLGACLLIITAGAYAMMQHAWLSLPTSCRGLELNAKGELQLLLNDGKSLAVTISPVSYINASVTILNVLDSRHRRFSVILTADRVEAESFRQLRVWLRWGRHHWQVEAQPKDVRE